MSQPRAQGAQHQHYVPQHMLRGFLSVDAKHAAKEQVHVFDLETKKEFTTSIANIMGERRYNEWWIDEQTIATIEPAVCKIEEHVLPTIERIRATRQLELSGKEHDDLALLLAFQFLRSKSMRSQMLRMERITERHVKRMGFKMEQVKDWEPLTEERVKQAHVRQQIGSLEEFTNIIADKVFFLATAPAGTTFYISDNPVVMANDQRPNGRWGNLGLGVAYVQLYMPLSSDLMLCAYGKELLGQYSRLHHEGVEEARKRAFEAMWRGDIPPHQMKAIIERVADSDGVERLREKVLAGVPDEIEPDRVQLYNQLQAFHAVRYVVDARADFAAAAEMIEERASAKALEEGADEPEEKWSAEMFDDEDAE